MRVLRVYVQLVYKLHNDLGEIMTQSVSVNFITKYNITLKI